MGGAFLQLLLIDSRNIARHRASSSTGKERLKGSGQYELPKSEDSTSQGVGEELHQHFVINLISCNKTYELKDSYVVPSATDRQHREQ